MMIDLQCLRRSPPPLMIDSTTALASHKIGQALSLGGQRRPSTALWRNKIGTCQSEMRTKDGQ
eukprot:354316-Chlamydomonas_euryale.AAC.1